jgi:DNA-binding NtrC family response regulator
MSKRIMVVDDDNASRAALVSALEVAGHEASCEASAEEALESLGARAGTDLAIVDVDLPGMDGLGFLERVRVLYPSVRVLLMTGRPAYGVMRRAWQDGALAVMDKPVKAEELFVKIEGALA